MLSRFGRFVSVVTVWWLAWYVTPDSQLLPAAAVRMHDCPDLPLFFPALNGSDHIALDPHDIKSGDGRWPRAIRRPAELAPGWVGTAASGAVGDAEAQARGEHELLHAVPSTPPSCWLATLAGGVVFARAGRQNCVAPRLRAVDLNRRRAEDGEPCAKAQRSFRARCGCRDVATSFPPAVVLVESIIEHPREAVPATIGLGRVCCVVEVLRARDFRPFGASSRRPVRLNFRVQREIGSLLSLILVSMPDGRLNCRSGQASAPAPGAR